MLRHLHVTNFVLIKEIDVDLDDHMNVFTGETGAGKSLLIDALNALCGARIGDSIVGRYDDKTTIEAIFSFTESDAAAVQLAELGIEETSEVFFSREISKTGKNVCRINLKTVTLAVLRSILESSIDIHSQHETQYLLRERSHLELLDQYMGEAKLCFDLKASVSTYRAAEEKKQALLNDNLNEAQIEIARDTLLQLETFKPSQADFDQLEDTSKKLSAFEKMNEALAQTIAAMDNEEGILAQFYGSLRVLHTLDEFSEVEAITRQLEEHYYQVEDLKDQLVHYQNTLEFDAEVYEETQNRLYEYGRLKRKFNRSIAELEQYQAELNQSILSFDDRELILRQLDQEIAQKREIALDFARKLSVKRKKSALKLQAEIVDCLRDLYLEDARFELEFSEQPLTSHGVDQVRFMISLNKGEPLGPLSANASGGELSRFMLGLKVVFSRIHGISTLVFDEIDSGVSGRVALRIGQKMHDLGETSQVIAVTHLAPVAACGDSHFLIEKSNSDAVTMTSVQKLSHSQRIEQLALIANGSKTDSALQAAEQLFRDARAHE